MNNVPARIFGALTFAYGVSAVLKPDILARHGELGPGTPAVRILSGTIGVRDLASGAAIVTAPAGAALQAALTARVLFDTGDAVLFGAFAPTTRARVKIAAVAGGWGAIGVALLRSSSDA